jgi:hypothetical protein
VKRSSPEFWAENIIESSRLCKNDREIKHFYSYIVDPCKYSYDVVESESYKVMGDTVKEDTTPYPANIKTHIYKNGNEYTIYNENTDDWSLKKSIPEEHDEKKEEE